MADGLIDPDLLLVTGAFNADGSKRLTDDLGTWNTDVLQMSLERSGDDILEGGEGDDILIGQKGNDTVRGDAGNDVIFGDEVQNTVLFETSLPQVLKGLRLLDAGGLPVQLEAGGTVVVPWVELSGHEAELYGPDLTHFSDANSAFYDQAVNDRLEYADGTQLEVYLSVVPDVIRHTDGLSGNDTLEGGSGQDLIFGDDAQMGSELLSGVKDVEEARQDLREALGDVVDHLYILSVDFDLLTHQVRGNAVPMHDIVIGSDVIDGGADSDTVFADRTTVFGGLFGGLPGTEQVTDSNYEATALGFNAFLRDLEHVTVDFGFAVEVARIQVLQDLVDDAIANNPQMKKPKKDEIINPDNHELFLYNDVILGGDAADVLIGDAAAIVADGVKWQRFGDDGWDLLQNEISKNVRKDVEKEVDDQDDDLKDDLKDHVKDHHIDLSSGDDDDDDDDDDDNLDEIDLIPYTFGIDLSGGNDTIDGEGGNDLIIGDQGVIGFPIVLESPEDNSERKDTRKGTDDLLKDWSDYLDDREKDLEGDHSELKDLDKHHDRDRNVEPVSTDLGTRSSSACRAGVP